MKQHKNTLVELGCEELPALQQRSLIEIWQRALITQLKDHKLSYDSIEGWCGPRRLSFLIKNLAVQSRGEKIIKEGPAKSLAYDENGAPTPACIGFARSCGVKPTQLVIRATPKGERLCYEKQVEGKKSVDLLAGLLNESLDPLHIYREMRWPQSPIPFIRAVRWLVLMVDSKKLSWQAFGLQSSNLTYGHRFLAPEPVKIDNAANYEKILLKTKVIANQHKRTEMIKAQAIRMTAKINAQLQLSPQLAEEIAGLVEYPTAYIGQFDKRFLQLPNEILDSVICGTQKYLMLTNEKNAPLASFIFIANITSKRPKQLIGGNEAVIAPRLEDAVFFYEQDIKTGLRFESLRQVAFFTDLGNMQQKSLRCLKLTSLMSKRLDLNKKPLELAARLCKCDLISLMVQEFPHLQGIMGGYYLLAAKDKPSSEDKICATILRQHYLPQRATDSLPDLLEACILSLVDKLDSLIGLFATNHKPSGTGDPYGLRRNALAIGRILIEKKLDLDITELLQFGFQSYISQELLNDKDASSFKQQTEIIDFIKERIYNYGSEQGLNTETLTAAFAADERPGRIYRQWLRAQALDKMTAADLSQLVGLNKRIKNILGTTQPPVEAFNQKNIKEKEEAALYKSYQNLAKKVNEKTDQLDYVAYSRLLIDLAEPLALFFDKVMVMAEDPQVRTNRLSLLNNIYRLFLQLGDLSSFSLKE